MDVHLAIFSTGWYFSWHAVRTIGSELQTGQLGRGSRWATRAGQVPEPPGAVSGVGAVLLAVGLARLVWWRGALGAAR